MNGSLEPGIHLSTFAAFSNEFGITLARRGMINGLEQALRDLKDCGCSRVFIDGSFVTRKITPGDYDACWDHIGVDLKKLRANYPLFFDFDDGRKNQKLYYKGEFFPAYAPAQFNPDVEYINFFQKDRDDKPKGIVQINLD